MRVWISLLHFPWVCEKVITCMTSNKENIWKISPAFYNVEFNWETRFRILHFTKYVLIFIPECYENCYIHVQLRTLIYHFKFKLLFLLNLLLKRRRHFGYPNQLFKIIFLNLIVFSVCAFEMVFFSRAWK